MVANECFLCTDPQVGFGLHKSLSQVKCYLADTGLLVSYALSENSRQRTELYKQIFEDKLGINQGMFYENLIAQMLTAQGHKLYFYAHYDSVRRRNDIEVDFLLTRFEESQPFKPKIVPLEVKSSKNYTTKSLDLFRQKFKKRIGECFIIHPRNLQNKNGVWCIPPYMTICL